MKIARPTPLTDAGTIRIRGARTHNLKGVDLDLPRNRLTVITGPSGSGKSSLAFDTLFAEGQRRYMLSLSSYVRQFLDRLDRPDVDSIEGLSPAIAIEQRTASGNPRSTIATTTEIFDHLRVLFATLGRPHHPVTGKPLQRWSVEDMATRILDEPAGDRFVLLAPLPTGDAGDLRGLLDRLRREGFARIRLDGTFLTLDENPKPDRNRTHQLEVVVDRLKVEPAARSRLSDSLELALKTGDGVVIVHWPPADGGTAVEWALSHRNFDPETGHRFADLSAGHFSFNNPLGACPRCHGLGTEIIADPTLCVPDPGKSLDDGAIAPWAKIPKRQTGHHRSLLRDLARHAGVSTATPWAALPESFRNLILEGSRGEPVPMATLRDGRVVTEPRPFEGLAAWIQDLHDRSESPLARQRLKRYMTRQTCRECAGKRLRPEILAVRLDRGPGAQPLGIHEFCALTASGALEFLEQNPWSDRDRAIGGELLTEIRGRLRFLCEVGLPYLTLDRETGTLSGGEMQRIRLASQLGSGLTGVLYVLDEPSIGLHPRDHARLLDTLRGLRDQGNTIVVVEHDEDTIRQADWVVEVGPSAGIHGGRITGMGTPREIIQNPTSLTGRYLAGTLDLFTGRRTAPEQGWITLEGVTENNLQNIDVRFPIGCLTCITGVSGSGKSTLIHDVLSRALFRHFGTGKERPGAHRRITGLEALEKAVIIDQSPIGRSPRSNAATYLGAFDGIRNLFAQLPLARVRGFTKSRFSFNTPGGRCEHCQGDGIITMEMQLLPDVHVTCEACKGRRFNRETLEITYKGHTIADVLGLTVEQALTLFKNIPEVADRLETLAYVGLGYLPLGQGGTSLSGGEAQRIKLAAELYRKTNGKTCYILDEPTTGLHFSDIEVLLSMLFKLRNAGNTILIIEHHLDVIKNADHIIDLGPGGGAAGGTVVVTGTPEQIAAHPASFTGQFLGPKLRAPRAGTQRPDPQDEPTLL
ncbi:MAG: excinuclease ABC subunit UvrA [Candidatus Methylacidiphilales bacterium]|nr:excinuclease ABC subunit UvrA [Candidatus Methylacidiphilales bacterium]